MAKYTIEYTRSVRVREYEILRIGIVEEFESPETMYGEAYEGIKNQVDMHIDTELARLRKEK